MMIVSFVCAFIIGILCVAPPEILNASSNISDSLGATYETFKGNYAIPMMVNSFLWLFLVVISSLLMLFLVFQSKLDRILKFLMVYILIGCFFSQIPYFSFNALILLSVTMCFFLLLKECDFSILINMAQAVFWVEIIFAAVHFVGKDTLMNFGRPEPVFFGTILQHMRFASLMCILSPIVLLKSKWYIIPICGAVVLTTSAGFALAVAFGVTVYLLLSYKGFRALIYTLGVALAVACFIVFVNNDSFKVALRDGRLPVWWVCLKSWVLDTRAPMGTPDIFGISQTGPFDAKAFLFGHGLDTFYNLFPAYKHDANPFPQAHNDWIQFAWEIGLVGFCLISAYSISLIKKLYALKEYVLISGLSMIAVNMFFHFPTRMTQTVLLIVFYVAYCEKVIEWGFVREVASDTQDSWWRRFVRKHILYVEKSAIQD